MKEELYQDRKYLITGASAGIGRAFTHELHRRGAEVLLTARRETRLRELCDALNEKRPGSASFRVVDLEDLEQLREMVSEVFADGSVFGVVSNAGFGSFGKFWEQERAREEAMTVVNCQAATALLHEAARRFQQAGEGVIIQLSSVAGYIALPYMSTYSATKAFDIHLGLGLYHELKPYGVRVLSVCPGPVATEFGDVAGFPDSKREDFAGDTSEAVVADSLRALEKGRAVVVPGFYGKLVGLGRFLPKSVSAWFAAHHLRRELGKR